MGTRIRPHQSKSFQPNGLLPNETTSVIRPIDPVLWEKAEERTAELISQIQPNWSSEQHRNAVASYVQRLITNCVPCQVFTFGSVPLKTYLPDGDIDLTVFSEDQNLKDSWAKEVRDMLEREEKNELAEFQVKEVQFIQAEVKIIKCLVDNIVVDISFNQLGGLCTLCFLEEVDNKINQNHLFKRSIILIKAWCYYESRILGAHHGLISTYALETLVLYTFLVFNNSFAGPLEVLYRFLEFFSKFDWANFCVSLWGPVPIASLPSMAADPPRKDAGELLLNKMFLTACSRAYSVFPGLQETQEQPFISKHFNVVDPLRVNNNLGRSVSKGNFYRIRSAFSFGAQHLARILDSREDDPVAAVNQFFVNTLDRHGKGCRPDAPIVDSAHLVVQVEPKGGGNLRKHSRSKQPLDNSVPHAPESIQSYSSLDSPRQPTLVRTDDVPEDVHTHKQKNRNDLTNQVASGWDDQYRQRHDLAEKQQDDGGGENRRAKIVQNRGRTKHQFARTYSSPELTNLARNMASQYTVVEKVEKEASSVSNYPRYTRGSSVSENHAVKQATDRTSIRESSKTREPSFNSNSVAGSTPQISSSGDDDSSPTHLQGQDVMNLMPPMGIPNYGGHVHMPVNLPSHQLVQIPPSMLGYGHPMFADWGTVMHRSSDGGPPFPLHHFNPVGVGRVDRGPDVMGRSNGGGAFTEFAHLQDEDDNGFWTTDSVADSIKEVDPASEDFSAASSRRSPTSPANSSRTKASSESSWDGKHSKMITTTTMMKYHHSGKKTRGGSRRATASDNNSNNNWQGDAAECIDQSYSDVDDDHKDWAPLSTSSQIEAQQLPGLGSVHMSYPTSMLPFAPVLVRPGAHQGVAHNHGGLVAFYPAGPPVPFLIHYVPSETSTSSAPSREHETGPSAKDPEQLNNYTDNYDTAERMAPGEHPDEGPSSDIFNSDFASHWKNLQYGRFCQVSQLQHHLVYPPSIVVSPQQQLQGELPFNGPNQQSPRSTNVFAQAVPVSAHRGSNKPAGVPRRYGGEVSKNRNGTGTYFPNPKVLRDRQFPNPRQYRGDYNYDRNEYHEREVNGNFSKSRYNGRGQARYYEKPNSKMDQTAAGAFQTDRQWDSFQHNSSHSYRSSNEQYIGTNGHAHGGYWRRGDHQPQNYHADSEPPSPDYASPPRFPGGDNA